jgi:hypothetical protein
MRRSLVDAERAPHAARRQALEWLAADLGEIVPASADPEKATTLVDVLRELVTTAPGDPGESSAALPAEYPGRHAQPHVPPLRAASFAAPSLAGG